jgi:hypothetical protein
MRAPAFDEAEFFRSIDRSGARALLIGRRALVLLGLPVLTADYDFWVHADDAGLFNTALAPQELLPTHTPDEARSRGRYALENDEHVDVLVARELPTVEGQKLRFDGVWDRRRAVQLTSDVRVYVPCLDDLIATKKVATRPKDLEDLRLLTILRDGGDQ